MTEHLLEDNFQAWLRDRLICGSPGVEMGTNHRFMSFCLLAEKVFGTSQTGLLWQRPDEVGQES